MNALGSRSCGSQFILHPSSFILAMSTAFRPKLTDHEDTPLAAYHALSAPAVVGLILGILSPAALVDPVLWAVPLAGIIISGWALRRIARSEAALIGRKAAVVGLVLCCFFAAAAATDWCAGRMLLRREARHVAERWFALLAGGDFQAAHHLTVDPRHRRPGAEQIAAFYREGPRRRKELDDYTARPLVRRLLDLGPKAEVRYLETGGQGCRRGRDVVYLLYGVTHEEAGRPRMFLVGMELERHQPENGPPAWRVAEAEEHEQEGHENTKTRNVEKAAGRQKTTSLSWFRTFVFS